MSDPISIVDIIKPKRAYKPRMSAVVSKAVLYKQLSEADLVPKIELPPTARIDTIVGVEAVVEAVIECLHTSALPTGLAVEEAQISPKNKPVKIIVGRCSDCCIDFTSELLFKRHLGTIKHKLTLYKLALHTTVGGKK